MQKFSQTLNVVLYYTYFNATDSAFQFFETQPVIVLGKGGKVRTVLLPISAWNEIYHFHGRSGAADAVSCPREGDDLEAHLDRT